jgi:ribosomal protein L37AE/L43A
MPTKCRVCGRILVKRIDTYYLVVCARCQVFAVGGEADGVDGARVMAHGRELLGFGICRVV